MPVLLSLVLGVLLGLADGPSLRVGAPANVGVDAARIEQAIDLFRAAVKSDDLKGVVLLLAKDGVIINHTAIGLRHVPQRLAMEKDSLFRMASNTKPVVAAAVLMLVAEGSVALDAPVGRYLPAFADGPSAAITVHQLLTHSSGLRIGGLFLDPPLATSEEHPDWPNLRAEVDRFAAVGPEVTPGTTFSYSNAGFNILGALVEAVSGQPLATFLAERIYRPLGMWDTSHVAVPERLHRMCGVVRRSDDAWQNGWHPGDAPDVPFVRASGGMISSATDYLRFCQMMLDGGVLDGERHLPAELVALATGARTRDLYPPEAAAQRTTFYGYGWTVEPGGVFAHGGSDGTFAWVDPARRLIGLVFTQSPGGASPIDEYRRQVEAACDAATPPGDLNRPFLDPAMEVATFVDRFETESREIAHRRDAIAGALGLKQGMAVADIGAGTGLFMAPFASAVGPAGRLYAVDISPPFIDHLRQRALQGGYSQVVPVLCTDRSCGLPAASIDLAFVCDTYHHFDHPADTLASLFQALRPGGALVVVDFERIPGVSRQWTLDHVRAGKEVFRAEIEAAGFSFVREEQVGLAENYMIRFLRP